MMLGWQTWNVLLPVIIVSYEQQIKNLIFNCRPEWLPELAKYYSTF